MDEFVESIPFTQTREYVQAILRNIEIYREIDASAMRRKRREGDERRLIPYMGGNPICN